VNDIMAGSAGPLDPRLNWAALSQTERDAAYDNNAAVRNSAALIADGDEYNGPVEVSASDLVLVKVRYKDANAAETDKAKEVAVSLAASAVHEDLEGADPDLRWAASVAGFAEILRGTPYARREALGTMSSLVDANAGADADRNQFRSLFRTARTLLGP